MSAEYISNVTYRLNDAVAHLDWTLYHLQRIETIDVRHQLMLAHNVDMLERTQTAMKDLLKEFCSVTD